MVDDDTPPPSLEAPKLFGRRRAASPQPAAAEETFVDSGSDVDTAVEPDPVVDDTDDTDATAVLPVQAPSRRSRRAPRDRSKALLPGREAAALSGAIAGLALVAFTWVGFRGCEAVSGTTACGTGPGLVALAVIVLLAVVAGGFALRACKIPDPGSTSFLGTGLTCVVCLLVPPLLDHLDHWSMVIVVPVITALTFLGAWKVTTTYVTTD